MGTYSTERRQSGIKDRRYPPVTRITRALVVDRETMRRMVKIHCGNLHQTARASTKYTTVGREAMSQIPLWESALEWLKKRGTKSVMIIDLDD